MIFAKPTKYGAGIELFGDYHDLNNLHDTIHHLADEQGPLDGGQEEFALGLAYEVRHAYQGDRETHRLPADISHSETGVYYSFRELWPTFLLQLGLLRHAAGFRPTAREQQANLYRLEACAEGSLNSYDPFVGRRCLEWLETFQGLSRKYLLQYPQNCALQYVTVGKPGKVRFKNLPDILRMMSPYSKEYREFEEYLEGEARKKGCQPADLADLGAWPDFKW